MDTAEEIKIGEIKEEIVNLDESDIPLKKNKINNFPNFSTY